MNINLSRILAIDYGSKRTGLAVTDQMQLIASGLTTVETKDLFVFLNDYFSKNIVSQVVVGEPKRLNNEPSQISVQINKFLEKFKVRYPNIEVIRLDERFTSKMAFQTMIDSGIRKKQRQNKALIDEIAATILLQDYLNQKMI